MKYIGIVLFIFVCSGIALAQHEKREDDIFFKKYLVRSMDLHEPANAEIFGSEQTMLHVLLDAYCAGQLQGYKDARLTQSLTYDEFEERLKLFLPEDDLQEPWHVVHTVEIGENLIFSKHTSDFYFSMETFTLFIPADKSYRGLQEPLISFKYNQCAKVFSASKEAVIVNPIKNGRDINYADLFLLRCFNSTVVKIGNSRDLYFDQVHTEKLSAFLASKAGENELTEYIFKLYNPD